MKKKIKNLTEEDVDKICDRYGGGVCNKKCPLYALPLLDCSSNCYETIKELKKKIKILEKQVEVEKLWILK